MFERDNYYYWHYRYDASGELAVAFRCDGFLNMSTIVDYINTWRRQNIIRDEDMIPDTNLRCNEGWELALSFDLCPCMEISWQGRGRSVHCNQVTL